MKQKLKLVLPNKQYAVSYLKGQKEYEKEGTKNIGGSGMDLFKTPKDFPKYNQRMIWNRKGINLPKGFVASTLYWAIVGNTFVGRLHLRHKLTKYLRTIGGNIGYSVVPNYRRKGYATEMLRQGILKARKLGIKKIMVSCDETNIGSKKVIKKNGGKLENRVKHQGIYKLRFWIK